ncbi:hypothetical protein [Streptomyces sp. enrichment culture]|uniref:hypothetical protein n=1 Tax=Streptomyces sp. enrichment culture TaxID=1795815 RepID=UPI003F54CB9E
MHAREHGQARVRRHRPRPAPPGPGRGHPHRLPHRGEGVVQPLDQQRVLAPLGQQTAARQAEQLGVVRLRQGQQRGNVGDEPGTNRHVGLQE